MLSKRIIPCFDIKDGETVKGVNFKELRSAGDPVELAKRYEKEGADELVFLDITATIEGRKTFVELVTKIAKVISIPFTVGGGVSALDDVKCLLDAGADKISINSAAVRQPDLIDQLAGEYGSQCIVVAIDCKKHADNDWLVYVEGGRTPTDREILSWSTEVVSRGAGEILLTSMDHDGVKNGFALEVTELVSKSVSVPVIASGGAGNAEHFIDVFNIAGADAALAASIFHFGEVPIPELKSRLSKAGIVIRE